MTPQQRRYWRNRQHAIEKWKAEHPDPPEGMMMRCDGDGFKTIAKAEEQAQWQLRMCSAPHWSNDPSYHWRKKA